MSSTTRTRASAVSDWQDSVCVITGAGSGIGAGLARYALQRGMQVVGADVDTAGLENLLASVPDYRDRLTLQTLDVTDADAVGEFAETVYRQHGAVNLLFNNAGVLVDGKCWERPLCDWRWIIDVNIIEDPIYNVMADKLS